MTKAQFDTFLSIGAGMCALLGLLNLLLIRKRGASAYLMASACLLVGLAMAYWRTAPGGTVPIACGIGSFLCLVADMVVRSRPKVKE